MIYGDYNQPFQIHIDKLASEDIGGWVYVICTPKVGLNNQRIKVQIFYDNIQTTVSKQAH